MTFALLHNVARQTINKLSLVTCRLNMTAEFTARHQNRSIALMKRTRNSTVQSNLAKGRIAVSPSRRGRRTMRSTLMRRYKRHF